MNERGEPNGRWREKRPGVRWYCPACQKAVVLYVPVRYASCTRCGRRMVKVTESETDGTKVATP